MNLMKGGGKGGLSKEVSVGTMIEGTPVLPIEMFQEIKKSQCEQDKNGRDVSDNAKIPSEDDSKCPGEALGN